MNPGKTRRAIDARLAQSESVEMEGDRMVMIETFRPFAEDYHQAIRQWKQETGKKVFGYFCCSVPEELLFAADVLPVRIVGTADSLEEVNSFVPPNTCPFARSCLNAGMQGRYDYLDGVVVPTSCDIMTVMDYFWERHVPGVREPDTFRGFDCRPYVYSVSYPEKVTGGEVLSFYLGVLRKLKQQLERALNRIISDEDLSRAISVYNRHKTQMRRLYELRKRHPPAVSGFEAWQVAFSATQMPKDRHAALLEDYLDRLEGDSREGTNGIRLFLSTGPLDTVDAAVLRVIEESGGQVVCDDMCFGTRSFWHPIDTQRPPLEAIALRSLAVPCPRSTSDARIPERRWEYINETANGFDVQGAVFYSMKCCDARLAEYPHLAAKVKQEWRVPVIHLEGDHTVAGVEQMRERIESFVEMIGG